MRISSLARIAVTASGICLTVATLAAGPAQAGAAQAGADPDAPAAAYYSAAGGLVSVGAASASSAWAVGYAGSSVSPKVLMVHWNGKAWSRVTSPSVLTVAGQLNSITVVNAKDAWAAGYTGGSTNVSRRTLLLHWNGKAWSAVTRPAPIVGFLDGVTATASGGWAVGGVANGHNFPTPLVLRLSGTSVSRLSVTGIAQPTGVAITGTNAAWAIAQTEQQSELARWNGHKWTEVNFPLADFYVLSGIAGEPNGTAFTVGWEVSNSGKQVPVALKLSGSTWKKVSVPSNATFDTVSFAPGGTAWAAGAIGTSYAILRWNGKAWTRTPAPSLGSSAVVDGLGFSSAKDGWAAGSSGSKTLLLQWNGSTWK